MRLKMPSGDIVLLDLNNPIFQKNLFTLPKDEKLAALNTLNKLITMTWIEVYCDRGLRWERIVSVKPPKGIDSIYSLRISRSCRATAYRNGNYMHFLTITANHDAAYGRK